MTLHGVDGQNIAGPGIADAIVREQVEIHVKYAGYIDRQAKEVQRHVHFDNLPMPQTIDYQDVPGLSIEVKQKLNKQKPETLGQCSRISGITPAAISLLLVYLKKRGYKDFSQTSLPADGVN